MYLAYGDYPHDSGEVTISVTREAVRSDSGIIIGFLEQWQINGILQANDVTSLTTAILALEAAYATNGKNIGLYEDNGTITAHSMLTARAQGGVRVVMPPSYPEGDHAEYVFQRKYQIGLEGRFITGSSKQIVAWSETLSFIGTGGPRFVTQQPLLGPPLKWQVASQTPCLATQFGQAIMLGEYPSPPGPIFPEHEHVDRRRIDQIGPQLINGGFQDYGISWSYEFESIKPLFGIPKLPRV